MVFKDYYKVMGLPDRATAADVKQAYRYLAKRFHPDVSKEQNAESRFQQVGEAYEMLSNSERRAKYDRIKALHTIAARSASQREYQPSKSSILSYRGKDLHQRIVVLLEEAVRGGQRALKLDAPTDGDRGRQFANSKTFIVKIPAGVVPLQRVRLNGQGSPGFGGGANGDLLLEFVFAPHPLFAVAGLDILLNLPVSPWEAALGAKVAIPTLTGLVSLTIPEGSVNGKKLRLKGRGLGRNPSGDQIVNLQVTLPAHHSAKARGLYRQLAELETPFNPRKSLQKQL